MNKFPKAYHQLYSASPDAQSQHGLLCTPCKWTSCRKRDREKEQCWNHNFIDQLYKYWSAHPSASVLFLAKMRSSTELVLAESWFSIFGLLFLAMGSSSPGLGLPFRARSLSAPELGLTILAEVSTFTDLPVLLDPPPWSHDWEASPSNNAESYIYVHKFTTLAWVLKYEGAVFLWQKHHTLDAWRETSAELNALLYRW